MIRLVLTIVCLCWSIGVSPAWGYRIAIFDFDDRQPFPDALGRHIESRLKALLDDAVVEQFCGRGDEKRAVRILVGIEQQDFDLAIVRTSDALIIAQHTLFNTPTLYTNANNPLILGFHTLGPPGGNISGVSYYIPVEKHLRVYRVIQPSLQHPGFIFDLNNQSCHGEIPETQEACARLGLTFDVEFVETTAQLPQAARALIGRGADAVVAATSGMIYENIDAFIDVTDQAGIPIYSFYKTGVQQGAVAAMSSDFFQMADELLLPMAVRVLRDKISPGDMPAAFLKRNKVFINIGQAGKLHLSIPDRIRLDASDLIIEKIP